MNIYYLTGKTSQAFDTFESRACIPFKPQMRETGGMFEALYSLEVSSKHLEVSPSLSVFVLNAFSIVFQLLPSFPSHVHFKGNWRA